MREADPALTPDDVPAPGVWDPERRQLTAGLVLTITLVAFEALAIATVMPKVEEDLDGLALYGWVFSGFFLANLAGIVITGVLTDRRGPVVPFAGGLVLFAAGLVVGGLAPSMPILVLARLAQGLGAGAIPASAYASVARGYPPSLRPRVFAVFSSAWVIPGIAGPSLAVVIERAASWRWVFLGLIPLVAVAGTMAVPALARLGGARAGAEDGPADPATPATQAARRSEERRRLGLVAGLVVGVGLVASAGRAGSGLGAGALVVVGLSLAAAAFVRLVPVGTSRLRPGLPAIVAVRGVLTWAFFGVDAYVSLAVVEGRGGTTTLAGATLTMTAVTWTAGAWIQESRVERLGPRRLDRMAFALILVGSTAMLVTALTLPAWAAIPSWGVAGLGMGLGHSALSVSALGSAPAGKEGEATAALQLCDTLGIAVGTGIGGALLALADGRGWAVSSGVALVFGLGIVVAAAGGLAAGRLPRRVPGA